MRGGAAHVVKHGVKQGLEALRVAVGRELEAGGGRAERHGRAGDARVVGDGAQLLAHAQLEHLREHGLGLGFGVRVRG